MSENEKEAALLEIEVQSSTSFKPKDNNEERMIEFLSEVIEQDNPELKGLKHGFMVIAISEDDDAGEYGGCTALSYLLDPLNKGGQTSIEQAFEVGYHSVIMTFLNSEVRSIISSSIDKAMSLCNFLRVRDMTKAQEDANESAQH